MPTVRQLFALLREDVEQEAIKETRKYQKESFEQRMSESEDNIRDAIYGSFLHIRTEKGNKYWQDIALNPPLKTQQDA